MSNTSAIPEGSVVLITAANGYVGSAISDYFLQKGLKVRGAVRSIERSAWVQAYFDERYPGQYELVQVPEMTTDGAYDEAVKGVSAVVHCASDVSFGANPHEVITPSIQSVLNVLKSAYAEPSVKRFVLTSSWAAAAPFGVEEPEVVTAESWSEGAIRASWADPPYGWERAGAVYYASKAQPEQELWKYYRENKERRPDLVVNAGERSFLNCVIMHTSGVLVLR
jgi:nucleoside-diphosphate-sugar epimerase